MTTQPCPAAVTLTPAERRHLDGLPGAVDDTLPAGRCAHAAGHEGPHAFLVQVQETTDEGVHWWVVWQGPAQTDGGVHGGVDGEGRDQVHGGGYAFEQIRPCWGTPEGGAGAAHGCLLPDGHVGAHRS
jgi:hypothetical protein